MRSPGLSGRARRWRELLTVAAVACVVEVGIRTLPLPRLADLLGCPLDPTETFPQEGEPPVWPLWTRARVHASRRVFRHWPFGDSCLRQALVLGWLLRALDPALKVGAARIDGETRAHAWLEIGGARLDPIGSAASYSVLVAPHSTEPT